MQFHIRKYCDNFGYVLLMTIFNLINISTSIAICNQELDVTALGVTVSWQTQKMNNLITSSPLCLNSTKMIQTRMCSDGNWIPSVPPICDYTQTRYEDVIKCPPDFIGIRYKNEKICVLFTNPQQWNETCLPYGSATNLLDLSKDLQKYVIEYIKQNYTKFWMPIKRPEKFEPLVWWLLPKWGEPFDFDDYKIQLNDDNFNGDCLSVNLISKVPIGNIEKCDKNYSILCLYQDKPLVQLACPFGSFTSRYYGEQNKCISIKNLNKYYQSYELMDVCNIFTVNSIQKTFLYDHLVRLTNLGKYETCAVNVIKSQDFYEGSFWNNWLNNIDEIDFVNWQTNLSSEGDITTINRNGKWNISPTVKCVVCDDEIEFQEPQITLKFDADNGKLFMTILSGNFLWKEVDDDDDDHPGVHCFTTSNNELLKKVEIDELIWSGNLTYNELASAHFMIQNTIPTISKKIYELNLYGDGPGYYWCEGHTIPALKLIKSQKIVAYKKLKGTVFAVFADIKCTQCNLISQKNYLTEIAKTFKKNLVKSKKIPVYMNHLIENVRVMKIESIDMINSMIRILFHISLKSNEDYDEHNDDDDSSEEESDELGVSSNILEIYFYKKILLKLLKLNSTPEFKFISLNHTEYCLPETLSIKDSLNWLSAHIREKIAPQELCLLSNGIPVTRKCLGDYLYGGIWDNVNEYITCGNKEDLSYLTRSLYRLGTKIFYENQTQLIINKVAKLITVVPNNYIPADLFYLSKVLNNVADILTIPTLNDTINNDTTTDNITFIINNIMNVNKIVAKKSQMELNTTNILLNAFDNIINKMSHHYYKSNNNNNNNNNNINNINIISLISSNNSDVNKIVDDDNDDGTIGVITPKLIVYMTDPTVQNISGFALYKNLTKYNLNERNNNFFDYYIKYLYVNQSIDDLLIIDNNDELEAATFIPSDLLKQLNEIKINTKLNTTTIPVEKPPIKIVVTFFYNDILFQENKNVTTQKAENIILSVSIPGFGSALPGLIPIFFKRTNLTVTNETMNPCGFWDFSPNDTDSTGEWSKDGCKFIGLSDNIDPVVLCSCSHLTHFALLVQGTYVHDLTTEDEFVIITKSHQEALDLITLLGCSLSLIGILGIAITAIMFRTWREKPSVKILLQLSGAIALQMILMCCVNTETITINIIGDDKWDKCIILGASLHYSVLVVFSWMLITAYLQFIRYVKVLGTNRPSRFFLKSFIVGWCLPLVPVLLVIVFAPETYIPPVTNSFSNVCYPSGFALYFGVLLPIVIIISANLIIFIMVIYSIVRGPDGKIRSNEKELTLSQLRLSIFLFFLLGLSWIFGLAVASKANIIFSYLFCLTATIQGFVLFVYFVLMDPTTRHLWSNFLSLKICKSFTKTID